jgi:hypothetical protein
MSPIGKMVDWDGDFWPAIGEICQNAGWNGDVANKSCAFLMDGSKRYISARFWNKMYV